jgi:chromosome segregation ATPase
MNTAQQTSLGITLREFEVRLARLRVLLEQYESVTHLTMEQVDRLRQAIERQQAMIDDLFRRFQLKRETIDVVQSMIAELSISWTQLVDSRSDKLGRYGEVDPELESTLDPAIDQMIEACLSMVRLLYKAKVDD